MRARALTCTCIACNCDCCFVAKGKGERVESTHKVVVVNSYRRATSVTKPSNVDVAPVLRGLGRTRVALITGISLHTSRLSMIFSPYGPSKTS